MRKPSARRLSIALALAIGLAGATPALAKRANHDDPDATINECVNNSGNETTEDNRNQDNGGGILSNVGNGDIGNNSLNGLTVNVLSWDDDATVVDGGSDEEVCNGQGGGGADVDSAGGDYSDVTFNGCVNNSGDETTEDNRNQHNGGGILSNVLNGDILNNALNGLSINVLSSDNDLTVVDGGSDEEVCNSDGGFGLAPASVSSSDSGGGLGGLLDLDGLLGLGGLLESLTSLAL